MPEAYGARHRRVRLLRALARDRQARLEVGACLVEGPRVISAALDRRAGLTDAYLGYGARPAFAPLVRRLEAAGVAVHDLKEGVLEKIGTTRTPQPVLGVAAFQPAELAATVVGRPAGPVVITVAVADPGNLGTILRSAEASGAAAVVVVGDGVDVRNPKVVRSSAGAVFGVPVVEAATTEEVVDELGVRGVACYGAVASGGAAPEAVALRGAAVVVGNEARGLPSSVVARLDGTVSIPMVPPAESLNVAMAATVLCFEAARQRRAEGVR